jgi:hypothetical protein
MLTFSGAKEPKGFVTQETSEPSQVRDFEYEPTTGTKSAGGMGSTYVLLVF